MTSKWERRLTNLFLATILTVFSIDAWPSDTWDTNGRHVHRIQLWLDPFVDVTGLWQGPWFLFAPIPPTENIYLRARFLYMHPNGTTFERAWFSPRWQTKWTQPIENDSDPAWWSPVQNVNDPTIKEHWVTSVWEKKRLFRIAEFFQEVRLDNNWAVWPSLSEHLADTHPLSIAEEDGTLTMMYPTMIGLYRHWQDISNPVVPRASSQSHWLLGEKVEPPSNTDYGSYMFYGWTEEWRKRPAPGQQQTKNTKEDAETEL